MSLYDPGEFEVEERPAWTRLPEELAIFLMGGGFVCFPGGKIEVTKRTYRRIEGDMVLVATQAPR